MMQCQNITRLPSPFRTLWMAFRNRHRRYTGTEEIPHLSAVLPAFTINEKHLARYKTLCSLEGDGIPPFYPLSLAYPMNLRLLSQKHIPFSMFRMLNREITISCSGLIPMGVPLRIHCAVASHTSTDKGVDLHLTTDIVHEGATIWSCTNTFFFKGVGIGKQEAPAKPECLHVPTPLDSGNKIATEKPPTLQGAESTTWFLPHGNGFRFASVCGDSNGAHYSNLYARMLGFEGAFAQPMLVMDKCLDKTGWRDLREGFSATIRLKGQLYYGRDLTLTYGESNEGKSFDLFCEGNERPCFTGLLRSKG